MSRTKGSSAQPGPQRWRQQPEQDVNAYTDGYYSDPAAPQPVNGAPHFPQHAFRHLSDRQAHAPQARPTFAQQLQRPAAAQQQPQPAAGHDRLSQRLQQADPRAAREPTWPTQPDPSDYDLAHYAPEPPLGNRAAPHDPRAAQHDPYAQQGYLDAAAEGWTGGEWNGQQQGYADPTLDNGHYAGYAQGDPNDPDYGYAYEGEEEEVQPPRRGPRTYMVMGVLVGAIAVGGGLAYAYKSLGTGEADGSTPVVRAERGPAKSRPADPGGREIAHTDKKFINRLGEDRSGALRPADGSPMATADTGSTGASSATDNDGGPRKVTTLVVNRDGSMAPPNPVVPLPQNNGSPLATSGVPGMVIDGLNSRPQRPVLRGSAAPDEGQSQAQPQGQAQAQRQNQQPAAASAPAKPQIIARADPAPEPPQRAPRKPVQREESAAEQAPARTAAVSAPTTAAASNGYVPVLSSQRSRMDALKAFADMQQKYTDVLQNRTPDVREVDLGEKGVWHRLVVGPPASREAASTVCTQLKAHGYSGCWVTAY